MATNKGSNYICIRQRKKLSENSNNVNKDKLPNPESTIEYTAPPHKTFNFPLTHNVRTTESSENRRAIANITQHSLM
jgi:hypothetical protein